MKKKKFIGLVLQVFIAFLCLFSVVIYSNSTIKPVKVYKYNKDFLQNDIITKNDLEAVQIPKAALNSIPNIITDENINEVFLEEDNTVMIADTKLYKDTIAVSNAIVPDYNADPFADIKNYGEYRMVSLPITYSDAFGGDIARGDMVDLIHIREIKDGNGSSIKSEKFLDNVLIYSLTSSDGDVYKSKISKSRLEATRKDIDTALTGGESGYGTLGTVTLLCTIEQAEEVYARQKTGSIKLAGKFSDEIQKTQGYEIRK